MRKRECFLGSGRIMEGNKLNFLVLRNESDYSTKTIAYNINYEIEKFLRSNCMGDTVELYLVAKPARDRD